jgi:acyl carrier protein
MSGDPRDELQELLREVLEQPDLEVHDELRPIDVAGWDSIAQVELVFAVEEHFGIAFPADEILAFEQVGELRAAIDAQLARDHG